jgi:predicted transposase YdaD
MLNSDTLYHKLFSHPLMVEDLVREFIPEAMAADLDFSKLQRTNAKFYTDREPARRRESDVIWRLPTHKGPDIYLMLEFQSESDSSMAVRTMVYEGLLWQQVIDEKLLHERALLPPLLLLVLYNGVYRWCAATDTRDSIALSSDSALWPWQPQVRYYLLDIHACPSEKLTGRSSLATLLFRLERQPSIDELKELVTELLGALPSHPDHAELRRLFLELVRRASTKLGLTESISEDLQMFKSNLDTLGDVWKQQWRAEGLAEGRAEGRALGKAEALCWVLAEKFGPLTPSLQERINSADSGSIDNWLRRAIAAPDLSAIFAPG